MKEIAEQREVYKLMACETFNSLSTAISRNDSSSYAMIVQVLNNLAESLGYNMEEVRPISSNNSSEVQNNAE